MTPYNTEIGAVEDVRYITSTIIQPWADGGAAKAGSGTTMISTGGTYSDVYPVLYLAENWFGVTPLKGVTGLTPFVKNPGESREGDQLGQRGWIGWKTYFTACVLNQLWGARAEIAIPEL
jgi:N4-gp56 family major capsid protein